MPGSCGTYGTDDHALVVVVSFRTQSRSTSVPGALGDGVSGYPHSMRLIVLVAAFAAAACSEDSDATRRVTVPESTEARPTPQGPQLATFGAGCFWCVEAVFQRLDGVLSVQSGYSGGTVPNPSYREVCNETTGHAEVAQIQYDPARVTFRELLEVFWSTHDPTTRDRQGNDHGARYRSAIFYHTEAQREEAEEIKAALEAEKVFDDPIVTEITKFEAFYAEKDPYHQDYFNANPTAGYCRAVIRPKVEKFEKAFAKKLKKAPTKTD